MIFLSKILNEITAVNKQTTMNILKWLYMNRKYVKVDYNNSKEWDSIEVNLGLYIDDINEEKNKKNLLDNKYKDITRLWVDIRGTITPIWENYDDLDYDFIEDCNLDITVADQYGEILDEFFSLDENKLNKLEPNFIYLIPSPRS